MKGWRKIRTIATFEFLTAVKRPGFLIATFGMPVFMAAYGALVAIPAYFANKADQQPSVYGVVDAGDVLGLEQEITSKPIALPEEVKRALQASGQAAQVEKALVQSSVVFRPMATEPEARTALAERRIKGYYVVPGDYLARGVIDVYGPDSLSFSGGDANNAFSAIVRERLLSGRIEPPTSQRILRPLAETRSFSVTRAGTLADASTAAQVTRIAVPMIFMVLFLLSVLMTSGYLMQGTATEKENKVVEVLLASANPEEILSGKLLGLGAAGLLQIGVWLSILLVSGLGVVPLLMSADVEMPWGALAMAVPLFLVSFLFYGSLMLGTGSLGSNMREAQQLSMVWSLMAALPMIMSMALIRDPHGVVARVMTLVPFSAAPLIIFRSSMDSALLRWWEIAGGFAILVISTWLAIRLGARLFRIGLVSASRPKLAEILRQARLG
jgi:ABC-2 type transport system permease protein